ncbi:methyltransferase domain-containing protein [Novosphingobium sp. P6W]|nr:methyltransferase domain-containing protein [Novosphingobium sp. P6W]KIS30838.1 methyltransferase type 11 [Novosphingobium sp. P6W]
MTARFSRRLSGGLARQLARPSGLPGRLLGNAMDIVNRKPMRLAIDLLAPQSGEAVLDAGCGTGIAISKILARADCSVIGADRSATMMATAQSRLGGRARYVSGKIECLALPDACLDAVLALNLLYFEGPDHAMLRALHRLLMPGGRLVAYLTHRRSMENWDFTREGLHRLYDGDELHHALCNAGFAKDRIEVREVAVTGSISGLLARAWR